jgi:hypothetical protein
MAMEVRCGQCYGILLIETPGVIVACPHCGVHLSFPGPEVETRSDSSFDHRDDSMVETPYPFKLPAGFSQPPVDSIASRIPGPNLPKESDPSALGPSALSQRVVSPTVVQPPLVSQPVVPHHPAAAYPVVNHPVANYPAVNHPAVTHQQQPVMQQPVAQLPAAQLPAAQPPAAQLPVVPQPVIQHPVARPVSPPAAQPQSAPDFSWMATSERSQPATGPSSVPFAGINLGYANVASEAQGVSSTSVSMGDVTRVEQPSSSGDSFSTPATPIQSHPSGQFEQGMHGNSASTPQFEMSIRQSPVGSHESTLNDVVDPGVFVAPSPTRPAVAKDRGSCLGLLLLIVGSYASLITIYAAYLTLLGRTHQLESLPDLKTVPQQGGRAIVPRPENELSRGHELKLGQSQRFGNVRVTPLRVTRGPMKFEYFKNVPGHERAPSEPVLKLWLKFENVSDHQIVTPIDSTLMYFQRGHSPVISYNVIFRDVDRKKKDGLFFYHFDRLPPESEWRIVGQDANRELLPHEEYNTFVPSQESVDILPGDVIWRVHFRKGYGPQTGNGVTTLIDVRFDSNEIEPDPA